MSDVKKFWAKGGVGRWLSFALMVEKRNAGNVHE